MSERVRFYTESHIAHAVVNALRERGVDVLTADQAGLHDAADELHLQFARGEGRVMVTRDGDFPGLHLRGIRHAGIIYFPQSRGIGHILECLILVSQDATAEEMVGEILYF